MIELLHKNNDFVKYNWVIDLQDRNSVYITRSSKAFRRNLSLAFSGWKKMTSRKSEWSRQQAHPCFLMGSYGVTTHKTVYFTLTTLRTSYLNRNVLFFTYGLSENIHSIKACSGYTSWVSPLLVNDTSDKKQHCNKMLSSSIMSCLSCNVFCFPLSIRSFYRHLQRKLS